MPVFKQLNFTTAIYERHLALGIGYYYYHRFEDARKNYDAA
jgi:hypothetical protein